MPMSALLLKGDIAEGDCHVRFVPEADITAICDILSTPQNVRL
jgi:hypothetical protein